MKLNFTEQKIVSMNQFLRHWTEMILLKCIGAKRKKCQTNNVANSSIVVVRKAIDPKTNFRRHFQKGQPTDFLKIRLRTGTGAGIGARARTAGLSNGDFSLEKGLFWYQIKCNNVIKITS